MLLISSSRMRHERHEDYIYRELLSYFSTISLKDKDLESHEVLGSAFNSLLRLFADSEGRRGGQFYTPSDVCAPLASLANPNSGMKVYDPTCGSGRMLVHCQKYVAGLAGQPDDLDVFGQEINAGTRAAMSLNMVFNGIKNFDIRLGDTLNNPLHIQNGQLVKFDRVVASPPFSLIRLGLGHCRQRSVPKI